MQLEVGALEVGAIIDGKVTGITKFGAFVDLGESKTGLVHISEISNVFVKEVKDHVKEGQEVKVKVLKIGDKGKIELSIKQASDNFVLKKSFSPKREFNNRAPSVANSFEDMMQKFMKASNEKIACMNNKNDGRRPRNGHKGNA